AEKMVLAILGGGCHLAVGCKITKNQNYKMKFFLAEENHILDFSLEAKDINGLLRELFHRVAGSDTKSNSKVIITPTIQHQLKAAKVLAKYNYQAIPWVLREVRPTFSISDFETYHSEFKAFDGLVFTSQFSVRIFFNEFVTRFPELLDYIKSLKIYAVGEATKTELEGYGITEVILPPEAHAVSMIDIIESKNPLLMGSSH